jgi:hypothetical protein
VSAITLLRANSCPACSITAPRAVSSITAAIFAIRNWSARGGRDPSSAILWPGRALPVAMRMKSPRV